MKILVIRVDGQEGVISGGVGFGDIAKIIGAAGALDSVNLFRNPANAGLYGFAKPVMMIDDAGYEVTEERVENRTILKPIKALKPVNQKATELYWSVCVPGTTHQIVGDVAIIDDEAV